MRGVSLSTSFSYQAKSPPARSKRPKLRMLAAACAEAVRPTMLEAQCIEVFI
jgi:hypothetical protein